MNRQKAQVMQRKILAGFAAFGAIASVAVVGPDAHASDKVYRIALSNSYIGNQWRVQMVNILNAYAEKYYKNKVKLSIVRSGTDVEAQMAKSKTTKDHGMIVT